MSSTVLITGAKGLIGVPLVNLLLSRGKTIHTLSRTPTNKNSSIKEFGWDTENGYLDERSLEGVEAIIHLAGENIGEKPWTIKRKQQIISSRTKSLQLLSGAIRSTTGANIKTLVSSSAVGYYGDRADEILTEDSPAGTGFLAETCVEWEQAADRAATEDLRLVKLRTGVVLATGGGALPKIAGPIKAGFGTVLGTGKQWMPWIHIDDVVHAYAHALEHDQVKGAYNLSSPQPVTNQVFTHEVAKVLKKNIWLPHVPELALRIALGEMKAIVLSSNRTDSAKLQQSGFDFRFSHLQDALLDLYG